MHIYMNQGTSNYFDSVGEGAARSPKATRSRTSACGEPRRRHAWELNSELIGVSFHRAQLEGI